MNDNSDSSDTMLGVVLGVIAAVLILATALCVGYYYFKVYKPNVNKFDPEMEALDRQMQELGITYQKGTK